MTPAKKRVGRLGSASPALCATDKVVSRVMTQTRRKVLSMDSFPFGPSLSHNSPFAESLNRGFRQEPWKLWCGGSGRATSATGNFMERSVILTPSGSAAELEKAADEAKGLDFLLLAFDFR